MNTAQLKKEYKERIAPALMKQFNYSSSMQIPVLKKIVINQGLGKAVADKKIIDVAINELTAITGQEAVATVSKKDVANFKLRKKMPIGVMVTLRRERMYEFLEKLVRVALPRIRDFKGIESKFDGRGNYTLGIQEQIIFPEINIDAIDSILGMNITFVTSAPTDEDPSQCQPHPPAQSLRDHGTPQRLHPPLRSLSYPIPRNGFGWLDSRCSQGFLVSIGTFKRNSFFI